MSYDHTLYRAFYERISELGPTEWFEVALVSNGLSTNLLEVTSSSIVSLVGGYDGSFIFSGPADAGATPKQLNVQKGDRVLLTWDSGGSGLNDGVEAIILAVTNTTLEVSPSLTFPDAGSTYKYRILRRCA